MSGHPGAALYGPSVCALPPVPRSARVAGGGGVDVAALAIAACAVVCRPGSGRELWIAAVVEFAALASEAGISVGELLRELQRRES